MSRGVSTEHRHVKSPRRVSSGGEVRAAGRSVCRTPYLNPSEPCQRSTLRMVADPKRIIPEQIDAKGVSHDMERHMGLPRTVQQYEKKHSTAASAKTGPEPKELRRMYRGFSVIGSWGEEDRQDDNWHRKENEEELKSERAESWQEVYPDFDDDG